MEWAQAQALALESAVARSEWRMVQQALQWRRWSLLQRLQWSQQAPALCAPPAGRESAAEQLGERSDSLVAWMQQRQRRRWTSSLSVEDLCAAQKISAAWNEHGGTSERTPLAAARAVSESTPAFTVPHVYTVVELRCKLPCSHASLLALAAAATPTVPVMLVRWSDHRVRSARCSVIRSD